MTVIENPIVGKPHVVKSEVDGGDTTLHVKCNIANGVFRIKTKTTDVERWVAGEHIQIVMPYLSADDRELLISGTSPEAWDKIFGD